MKKIYVVAVAFADEMRALEERQEAFLSDNREAFIYTEEEDSDARPYQVINGIALYDISGKMMSKGNFFTRVFGIPTYEDIGNALGMMATDDEVKYPLISMSTPGGVVGGISDLSDSWSRLNAEKPITVHTSSFLGSAGVWLASNSDKIYASEVAEVGSIGAIMQHVSYKKALEKEGLKVTTIRSSPLKAIGSPADDLSGEDLAHLQGKIDETGELFKKQLYRNRPGVHPEAMTGEMFSASEAMQVGLIDGIKTFSDVFDELSATAADRNNKTSYMEEYVMKKKVTAAMAEAAISAGADPKTLEIVSQEEYDAYLAEHETQEPENLDTEVEDLETEASEQEVGAEAEESNDGDDEQVASLTASLIEANAENEGLVAKVKELEDKLTAANADPLRIIAEERISVMRVALGLTSVDMSKFSTSSILAEYQALDEQFKKSFKSGGYAPSKKTDHKADVKVASIHSFDRAHLRAVGIK